MDYRSVSRFPVSNIFSSNEELLLTMEISGNVLTNVIIVLDRIFKYLSARQLNTCARVCTTWYQQAKREKASRIKLRWNSFKYGSDADNSDLDENWCISLNSYIMDSPMEPSCLLLFCTDTLWSRSNVTEQSEQSNGSVRTKKVIKEFLDKSLPRKCVYHVVVTDGIVGTDCNMKTEEMEDYTMSISLLMLGHSVETEFIPFSFSHSDCRLLTKCWDENGKKIPEFMSTLLQKPVKMVNLYCPMSGIEQEISYSMYRNLRKPLIAGGYVNEKVLKDLRGHTHSSDEGSIVSGLAFCGEGVQVASVLIRSEVEEEAEADAAIQKLTEYKFPLLHSFGLMYACVGRGMHVYSKHNVESSIFRKYFPNTPLLGFFGNGEIGCCYPPANRSSPSSHVDDVDGGVRLTAAQMKRRRANMETDKQDLEMKHPPKLLHAYTTVMCLISLP